MVPVQNVAPVVSVPVVMTVPNVAMAKFIVTNAMAKAMLGAMNAMGRPPLFVQPVMEKGKYE
jgi:hypothetical protein